MNDRRSKGYGQPNNGLFTATALILVTIAGGTALSVFAVRLAGL
jgi:hypothetical protein